MDEHHGPQMGAQAVGQEWRLSRIGLRAPEAEELARFYRNTFGMVAESGEDGSWRLGARSGEVMLEIARGPKGVTHIALEASSHSALRACPERLAGAGIETTSIGSPVDGAGAEGVQVLDPNGTRVLLHAPTDAGPHARGPLPLPLHHVVFATPDLPETVAFYVDGLGFRISDHMGENFAWLRCNHEHHTIAVVKSSDPGLDHLCFELGDWDDFRTWGDALARQGTPIRWGPGRHGPGNNLFVFIEDPAGFRIELSAEMEQVWDELAPRPPREWLVDSRTLNLWGPLPDWRNESLANQSEQAGLPR